MRRTDLIHQLGALTEQLEPVLLPTAGIEHLQALCLTARLSFGAVAVSVAARHDDVLRYVASSGPGADAIVGTELSVSRGIAGYVALTGLSLAGVDSYWQTFATGCLVIIAVALDQYLRRASK